MAETACHRRDTCRLCGGADLTRVLALAPTPPANAFVPEAALGQPQESFPLDVFFCETCHHVQLLDVVDPAVLFRDYVYVSGTSPVFVKHFQDYAAQVARRFALADGGLAVDIGSNDGTLLKAFRDEGLRVLGVDPARDIAARATEQGVETLADFFTPALARRIRDERGLSIIVSEQVLSFALEIADRILVLEKEQEAIRRGAKIHAVIAGYGGACDAAAHRPDGCICS